MNASGRFQPMPGPPRHSGLEAVALGDLNADGVLDIVTLDDHGAISRASIVGQHEGFIKIVSDSDYGEILGVHIIGPQATELIAEAVVAMEFRASSEDIARICHAHPSLSEATKEAALAVDKRTLNL